MTAVAVLLATVTACVATIAGVAILYRLGSELARRGPLREDFVMQWAESQRAKVERLQSQVDRLQDANTREVMARRKANEHADALARSLDAVMKDRDEACARLDALQAKSEGVRL